MTELISPSLAYKLNFFHPLLMWALLGLSLYSMYLGIKTKKLRTASAEVIKEEHDSAVRARAAQVAAA